LCLSDWDVKFVLGKLAEIICLRNKSLKDSWLRWTAFFFFMVGCLFCIREGLGVMKLSNIQLCKFEAVVNKPSCTANKKFGSYYRLTKLESLRDRSQKSILLKNPFVLWALGG
jgi:hypothetical protein